MLFVCRLTLSSFLEAATGWCSALQFNWGYAVFTRPSTTDHLELSQLDADFDTVRDVVLDIYIQKAKNKRTLKRRVCMPLRGRLSVWCPHDGLAPGVHQTKGEGGVVTCGFVAWWEERRHLF